MKRYLSILCSLILALSLTVCGADFDDRRMGNNNESVMDHKILNTTDSQDLIVEEGDTIHVSIIIEGGSLLFKIQKDNETPIYGSKDISLPDEVDVGIEENGTYVVTIAGKKVKGSVSFTVVTSRQLMF